MSLIKLYAAARHVDALLVTQGPSAGPSRDHIPGVEPVVYGEPIHAEADSIVARYRRDSLSGFLAHEARFAVGNYALVESKPNSCRIITSPGYCGGYYHCQNGHAVAGTLLASVLGAASGKIEMDPFGLCFYLSHAPNSSFGQFPLSSMFKGVDRIPPASVIEFENGALVACYSYLIEAAQLPLPASFEQAMDEATNAFADYYSRTGKKPLVMFSGGVDSLLIYLSLRRKMNPADIRVATMDHSTSNGPARAYPISRKLNFDLELYSLETLNSSTSRAATMDMMSKDIISARAPHIALTSNLPSADILHGQNMDSMVKINMTVLQANLERGLLSKVKIAETVSDGDKLKQYETFLGNLQFTHEYLEDIELQRNTVDFFAKKSRLAPFTTGPDGVICGMLSSQHPNLVTRSPFAKERNSFIRAEASKFKRFVGPRGLDNRYVVDLVRYLTYAHLSGKRLSSLPLADGSRVNLVAMAGPIVSYCIGRRRGISQATHPKQEVYALAKQLSGMDYSELASDEGGKYKFAGNSKRGPANALLFDNIDKIRPDNSLILDAIADTTMRNHVEGIYNSITTDSDSEHYTEFNLSRGRLILNLELIMAAATNAASAAASRRAG